MIRQRWIAVGLAVWTLAAGAQIALGQEAKAPSPAPAQPPNVHAPTPGNVVQPVRPQTPVVAARTLFGAKTGPAPLAARAIGSYAKGCLAGATALPVDGAAWQVMRLSRNRNWGHPELISLLQTFAAEAKAKDGWPGLLVGDISQPRGGPMLTGHASHQIGLDADIWFTPMPARKLSKSEREDMSAMSMLAPGELTVDRNVFTATHVKLLKRAASYAKVERVLVHPAIKKAVCEMTTGDPDRAWLSKLRPYWGHYFHFHVRIGCPADATDCTHQAAVPGDDGCGKEVADWLKLIARPARPGPPPSEQRQITMEQLPAQCRVVLEAGRS